jgi:hypothetical protein
MPKPQNPPQPPKQRTRGLSRYKRSETTRLVRGVLDAGLSIRGVEADPDTGAVRVLVEPGKGEPKETSPLEQWKATRG